MVENLNNPEKEKPEDQREPDLHGTISSPKKPTQRIKIFFSRKIWIAILTSLGVMIIGAIVEMFVQTPISKYIDRVTGVRIVTLKRQLKAGNYEFVYHSIKEKYHNEPYDENHEKLYFQSTEGLLKDFIKEYEWEKAQTFLTEATEGMPIPKEFRLQLRQIYVSAMPERIKHFIKKERNANDGPQRLGKIWEDLEMLALKEKEDPLIQFEVGRAQAAMSWNVRAYNLGSLEYFEKSLVLDKQRKDDELLHAVIRQAFKLYPEHWSAKMARKIVQTQMSDTYIQSLKESLKLKQSKEQLANEMLEDKYLRLNSSMVVESLNRVGGQKVLQKTTQ